MDEKICELLKEWGDRYFAYGESDCCQFAAAAARKIHGITVDIAPYKTIRQAARVLQDMGGLQSALTNAGFMEGPYAMRGDIVIVKHPGAFGLALALHTGNAVMIPASHGLAVVPRAECLSYWSPHATSSCSVGR